MYYKEINEIRLIKFCENWIQREKMQSSDEIIKEKTGFRKNKREITKWERKSKREQDLNVFIIRTNVK